MATELYNNDPVIKFIDKTIEDIEKEEEFSKKYQVPTRKQVLDTHLAYLKVVLM